MRPAARVKAAIDVLAEIITRHRPASAALADWGKANRYAGSGDRAVIGNHVYDALRRRAGAEHLMQAVTPRAVMLGTLRLADDLDTAAVSALFDGGQHAAAALTDAERRLLDLRSAPPAQPHIAAEVPAWAFALFETAFGADAVTQGLALAERAPVDVRANTLAATRETLAKAFAKYDVQPTRWSRLGLRLPVDPMSKRTPNVEGDLAHGRGWFEVQDEGSQIAAALTGVQPGMSVLDLCAGAGGKTLALGAAMQNQGRLVAYDTDRLRLRPIVERLKRAEVTNVEALAGPELSKLDGDQFDVVLVDAPCTGSGTWRRKPDAKWRTKPASLDKRRAEQVAVLDQAAPFVKPGGRLVYVTCSVFPSENVEQIAAFRARHSQFEIVPTAAAWAAASAGALHDTVPASADGRSDTLLLTPATHGTDGFFVAVMGRGS